MLLYFIFYIEMTFSLWIYGGQGVFPHPICTFLAGVLRWQLLHPSHSFGAGGEGIMDSVARWALCLLSNPVDSSASAISREHSTWENHKQMKKFSTLSKQQFKNFFFKLDDLPMEEKHPRSRLEGDVTSVVVFPLKPCGITPVGPPDQQLEL